MENNNNRFESKHGFFVAVRFSNSSKTYFFSIGDAFVPSDTPVILETVRGTELGFTSGTPVAMAAYRSNLLLKPITRIANKADLDNFEENKKDARIATYFFNKTIKELRLNMDLITCEYTLDRSKLLFSYLAEDRIDFRELLKILAREFKTRIELKQLGGRDRAKAIGGIGICGLPICCATFLTDFDNISINRAKNQMLTLNIPKLSGHCGKLICCLNYEDEVYTELKSSFPKLGQKVRHDGKIYKITAMNVLTRVIKIEGDGEVLFLPLAEVNKMPRVEGPSVSEAS